ncbi:MAG: hypothetical protein KGJ23_15410 [Euryarchaeota archaeon]|nr:hypothetical protein [Euryarchaeota archaeon]MDE1881401.1 hypothetical protein [Euryarchaeota archaeon]MDE2046425.1 hypothetical protein [Thermoplasmata archaeon]
MERRRVNRETLLKVARGRVLTTRDLARVLGVSPRNAAKTAFDLRARGFLKAVQRGVYAAVPLDVEPRGFHPDPFLAVHRALGERYVFSHFSALALLGAEQQVRNVIHVEARGVRPRRRTVGETSLRVHASPAHAWEGVTRRVRRGGATLLVTTPAQTLVDLAGLSGPEQDYEGTFEAFRSLLPRVDPVDLSRAARGVSNTAALARLGHFLARAVGDPPKLRGFEPVLSDLERAVARSSPKYLGTRPRAPSNRYDRRFRVVYPEVRRWSK